MTLNKLGASAIIACVLLNGCSVLTPKAVEPTGGPRARIRIVNDGGGDLSVFPAKQPGGNRGSFEGHSMLYPGQRHRLGMPVGPDKIGSYDEYYVIGDQEISYVFSDSQFIYGDKYSPGGHIQCGPIDGTFHVEAGKDYQIAPNSTGKNQLFGQHTCTVSVVELVDAGDGQVTYRPVAVGPRWLPAR